jgi:hypothetical protein
MFTWVYSPYMVAAPFRGASALHEIESINHGRFGSIVVDYCNWQAQRHVPMTNACRPEPSQHLRDSPQDIAQRIEDSTTSRHSLLIVQESCSTSGRIDTNKYQRPSRPHINLALELKNHPINEHNAHRDLRPSTLPHSPQRTHLPHCRLLRNMVSALQTNRTHLQPTLHRTCITRQVRIRQNQR